MDPTPVEIDEAICGYGRTLGLIANAMNEAFGPEAAYGLCGFREESLVMFLAETLRSLSWNVKYEKPYGNSYQRCDIVARRPENFGAPIWFEAKWWWLQTDLRSVFGIDEQKIRSIDSTCHAVVVIFTADEIGKTEGTKRWDLNGAGDWMRQCLKDEGLQNKWRFLGCTVAPSPYVLIGKSIRAGERINGLFAAAFFEYMGRNQS
jgi:hypothetical protein